MSSLKSNLLLLSLSLFSFFILLAPQAEAVSPEQVLVGKQLFEQTWESRDSKLASDGLGPLFNGSSCAQCHRQGGVGGGGEAEFNAKSIGIEQMRIRGGPVSGDTVARMLSTFHPGFIQPSGRMLNTMALSHHGGTSLYVDSRSELLSRLPAEFSTSGGPQNALEVRRINAVPIHFENQVGNYQIALTARMFQRNTSALFGTGLIDQVSDKTIKQMAKEQERHPEISGRPSTLSDGRYGKFGWRGNVASLIEFTDQACANELGLQTQRKTQPSDPTNPNYQNSSDDISDAQIEAMNAFVVSLPPPTRFVPDSTQARLEIQRGERLFASIRCSVCHVQDVGPAKGIYSDLLLHDMGFESTDYNHAEPYIKRITPVTRYSTTGTVRTSGSGMQGVYYGPSTEISVNMTERINSPSGRVTRGLDRDLPFVSGHRDSSFEFRVPEFPTQTLQFVELGTQRLGSTTSIDKTDTLLNRRDNVVARGDFTVERTETVFANHYVRVHFEPTKINQEWRTPPLWGVRDSAPYLHDGRAETLLEAIAMHDGEAAGTRDRFLSLSFADRQAILAFLNSLVAPQGNQLLEQLSAVVR